MNFQTQRTRELSTLTKGLAVAGDLSATAHGHTVSVLRRFEEKSSNGWVKSIPEREAVPLSGENYHTAHDAQLASVRLLA